MFSLLLFLSFAHADSALLKPYPMEVLRNEVVKFGPVPLHHFSNEAPQDCGEGTLIEKTAREITCQFQKSGNTQITLNVCDDKKTFCKPIEITMTVRAEVAEQEILKPKDLKGIEELRKILVPGFVEGTPAEIRNAAMQRKQGVFVMISTEWCPPCNETKEYLLTSPSFASLSKDWFKVYVDGDSLIAGEWEKVIPYNAFPTLVFLNSEFQEVGRFTRELRLKEFSDWSTQQTALIKDPIVKLRERVLARQRNSLGQTIADVFSSQEIKTNENMRLLAWAIDADAKALVEQLRKGATLPDNMKIKLASYDVQQLGEADKEKKEALLTDLITWTAERDDFADYLSMLCGLNVEKCKKFIPQMEKRMDIIGKWTGLTDGERASALGEEGLMQQEIYQTLGDAAKAKQMATFCADQYGQLVKDSKLKTARAANQGLVHCLEMSGRNAEAQALVEQLIQAYPHEPTFLIRMARLKKKQKKLDEAYQWVKKAEKLAYGYNWYSAVLMKANLEIEMKKNREALGTLNGALAQVSLPEEKDRRNHLVVQRIRNLQASIKGQNTVQ